MAKIYSGDLENSQIGCIIIDEIIFFKNEVILSDLDIKFQKSIVSGKGIGEEEVNRILSKNNPVNNSKDLSVFEYDGYYDIVAEEEKIILRDIIISPYLIIRKVM